MTAHNFPNSPSVGDISVANGISFKWTGTKWVIYTKAVTNPVVTSYNGVLDLNKGTHFKIPLTYSGSLLSLTQSFINIPSSSFRCTVELVQNRTINQQFIMNAVSYDGTATAALAETSTTGIFIRADGKKMFISGTGADSVYAYNLSTAWDVSTAAYFGETISVTGQETNPVDVHFNSTGTKMYILGDTTGDRIYSYTLIVPWMLTTATYDGAGSISPALTAQDANPSAMHFKPDGTKVFILGSTSDTVYAYTLSTAWDLTTITYDSVSFAVTTQTGTSSSGLCFSPDGKRMYVLGTGNDILYSYTLGTAWNISTAVYDSLPFSTIGQDNTASKIFFKTDGSKMYLLGYTSDKVYQYSGSFCTATWDSKIIWSNGTSPTIAGSGSQILEFYSSNGTEIYGRILFDGTI